MWSGDLTAICPGKDVALSHRGSSMPGMELALAVVAILVPWSLWTCAQLADSGRSAVPRGLQCRRRAAETGVDRHPPRPGPCPGRAEQLKARYPGRARPPLPRARSAGLSDLREQLAPLTVSPSQAPKSRTRGLPARPRPGAGRAARGWRRRSSFQVSVREPLHKRPGGGVAQQAAMAGSAGARGSARIRGACAKASAHCA